MIAVANDRDQREELRGLECPDCGCFDSRVVDTRKWFRQIRRTRQCEACGGRWHTNEKPVITREDAGLAEALDRLVRQWRRSP